MMRTLLLYKNYLLVLSMAILVYAIWSDAMQWKEQCYRWAKGG